MKVRNEVNFAIIPEWLLLAEVSANAVRVYGVLHRHADRTGRCHPSRRRLADLLRISLPTVDRSVKELQKVGALQVEQRFAKNGDQTSNRYLLMVRPPSSHMTTPLFTNEATPLITSDEQNESQLERESSSYEEERTTAQTILKEVLPKGKKHPSRFVGHLAKEIGGLLAEGFPPAEVTAAARLCESKGLSPGTLASLVVQVRSRRGYSNDQEWSEAERGIA